MTRLFSQIAKPLAVVVFYIALDANVTASTRVLSFGSNGGGATGLGTHRDLTLVATPINASNLGGMPITQVAAGGARSLLLAENGSVFWFGTGAGDKASPIDASNLGGRKIIQVSAGLDHSLLLAADGDVFSFGSNMVGQTGLGITSNFPSLTATPIDESNLGGRKITQVAAGNVFSLLLAEDGTVFSFGLNMNGQLGRGSTSSVNASIAMPIDASNLGGRKITQVAAGGQHGLLLADDGSVFSFGDNRYGQGGLGMTSELIYPTVTPTPIVASNLGGRAIRQVAAGGAHSLLLADDGSVFSFGWNPDGATGLGTSGGLTLVATPIDSSNLGGRAITQVATNEDHSLLLADDGTVFGFGSNAYGQTGLGTSSGLTLVATPIDSSKLNGHAVTQIAAGWAHNLLLDPVPEPGSFALACLAVTGLWGVSWGSSRLNRSTPRFSSIRHRKDDS